MTRVIIFGKAKIGTMDGHFSLNQIFGPVIAFDQKRDAQIQIVTAAAPTVGVISKKKEKVTTYFAARLLSFSAGIVIEVGLAVIVD